MFRFTLAVAANASLLGYATYWRKKVDKAYENMDENSKREIYENCPTQKFASSGDGISALQEKIYTNNPSLHENDKPLKPFKS